MEYLFRNLLELYFGTFIRFVYLRYIRRKDVRFKELLHPAQKERLTKIMSWTYSRMKWLTEVMVVFFL